MTDSPNPSGIRIFTARPIVCTICGHGPYEYMTGLKNHLAAKHGVAEPSLGSFLSQPGRGRVDRSFLTGVDDDE